MFEQARNDVDLRFDGAVRLFNSVCATRVKADIQRIKGLAFVEMYAYYEFAVHAAVRGALSAIKAANFGHSKSIAALQGLVFDAEFNSCSQVGKSQKWKSRAALFTRMQGASTEDINVELFPVDGTHYRRGQLETIWAIFGVKGQIVPDGRLFPLIGEMVECRNAVAHGREKPEDIGRPYSPNEIRRKFGQSKRLSKHVLTAVEKRVNELIAAAKK